MAHSGLIGMETEEEAVGGRHSPLRRCIATGMVRPKDDLIRFVVAPDGAVVPDLEGSLPGRGLWVTADSTILRQAIARKAFARAARRPVRTDPELVGQVTGLLARRCLDLIGLARRAGRAVAGFEKVRAWLEAGKAGVLLEATDGSPDGRSKLAAKAGDLPVVMLFTAAELGAALGRGHAVHAAVAPGRLAERLLGEARRYAGLAGLPLTGTGGDVSGDRAAAGSAGMARTNATRGSDTGPTARRSATRQHD